MFGNLKVGTRLALGFGARVRSDFLHGVGKVRGKFVLLLDVDRALSLDDIGEAADAVAASEVSTSAAEPVPA